MAKVIAMGEAGAVPSPDEGHPAVVAPTPAGAAPQHAAPPAQEVPAPEKTYKASIYQSCGPTLPPDFAKAAVALQASLKMPIWLLLQSGEGRFDSLDDSVVGALLAMKDELPEKQPVALLLDSPGGYAKSAYQIGTILRGHCGSYTVVVPRYAKSAATLLSLGAKTILLGKYAELGPLDAQFHDRDREEPISALDEVQALERLHAFALEAVDRTMFLMTPRTGKKIETLLPMVLHFGADIARPLFEKLDAIHYTQMSRALKVAEEYAVRLLQVHYNGDKAREIARHLVEKYPEHGFVVDAAECATFGLKTASTSPEQQRMIEEMMPHLTRLNAVGTLKEVPPDA